MEVIIIAVLNTLQLLLLAYLASRARGIRQLMVTLLKDLQYDLSMMDRDKSIAEFPYRAEFLLALDILVRILDRDRVTVNTSKET